MEFPHLEPKGLNDQVGIVINYINGIGKNKVYPNDLELEECANLFDYKESFKKILNYLIEIKCITGYEFQDFIFPSHPFESVVLFGVDYDITDLYGKQSAQKILWMLEADAKGKNISQDFWFKNDTLYYKGRELELLGFQARLCEFLFDNLETNERIEEGKAIAFIVGEGGDELLDIKDLTKQVNRKIKEYFRLDKSVIKRENGKIFRIF